MFLYFILLCENMNCSLKILFSVDLLKIVSNGFIIVNFVYVCKSVPVEVSVVGSFCSWS